MKERLYQAGFDGSFKDVTPKNFEGVSYRIREAERFNRYVKELTKDYRVRTPADAANYLMEHVYNPFEDFEQEEFTVLLLNTKNRITHQVNLYRGTPNTIPIRNADVYRDAVRHNAMGIIVSHIHPSGEIDPSPEDIRATRDLLKAGQVLGIDFLDHVLIGNQRWMSFKERNLGFY